MCGHEEDRSRCALLAETPSNRRARAQGVCRRQIRATSWLVAVGLALSRHSSETGDVPH
jgi:hypothetical protein